MGPAAALDWSNVHVHSRLVDRVTARVDLEAEVDARADLMFRLLADPRQHEHIFDAIEGATCQLLEATGSRKRWLLDYQARWKFWAVSGVCTNRLIMESDSSTGTVTFKLREPGFLRVYEGTWVITPLGHAPAACAAPTRAAPGRQGSTATRRVNGACNAAAGQQQHCGVGPAGALASVQQAVLDGLANSAGVRGCRVRVERMLVSPKIAPPIPLNQLLKGQAVGQVQDMLRGLLAAAKKLELEEEEQQQQQQPGGSSGQDGLLTVSPRAARQVRALTDSVSVSSGLRTDDGSGSSSSSLCCTPRSRSTSSASSGGSFTSARSDSSGAL